jgi:hypothetical protein
LVEEGGLISEGAQNVRLGMKRSTAIWLTSLMIGVFIASVVLVPIFLEALFPPTFIEEARVLAGDVSGLVSESAVSAYLTSSERDIANGILSPTNCVPPWFTGVRNPNRRRSPMVFASRWEGTNLCVTATFSDGHSISHMTFCNDPDVHRAGRLNIITYAVTVWTNCSVTVNRWGR